MPEFENLFADQYLQSFAGRAASKVLGALQGLPGVRELMSPTRPPVTPTGVGASTIPQPRRAYYNALDKIGVKDPRLPDTIYNLVSGMFNDPQVGSLGAVAPLAGKGVALTSDEAWRLIEQVLPKLTRFAKSALRGRGLRSEAVGDITNDAAIALQEGLTAGKIPAAEIDRVAAGIVKNKAAEMGRVAGRERPLEIGAAGAGEESGLSLADIASQRLGLTPQETMFGGLAGPKGALRPSMANPATPDEYASGLYRSDLTGRVAGAFHAPTTPAANALERGVYQGLKEGKDPERIMRELSSELGGVNPDEVKRLMNQYQREFIPTIQAAPKVVLRAEDLGKLRDPIQREVVEAQMSGKGAREIARELGLGRMTVERKLEAAANVPVVDAAADLKALRKAADLLAGPQRDAFRRTIFGLPAAEQRAAEMYFLRKRNASEIVNRTGVALPKLFEVANQAYSRAIAVK